MTRAPKKPFFSPGQTVVLFGGSFDPPHKGHDLVAKAALRQLKADFVWWLVSPQNPLKNRRAGGLAARVAATRELAHHPKFIVTAEETRLGTQYALDTVHALQKAYPHVHFIWLIGTDNLAQLHRWKGWRTLMRDIPIAVYPRPTHGVKALASPAAQRFSRHRVTTGEIGQLRFLRPPAWGLLAGPQSTQSSTALRASTKEN